VAGLDERVVAEVGSGPGGARPAVVLVVDPAVRPLVEDLGLADECLTFEA